MRLTKYLIAVAVLLSVIAATPIFANNNNNVPAPIRYKTTLPQAAVGIMLDDKTNALAPYLSVVYRWFTVGAGASLHQSKHRVDGKTTSWTEPAFLAHIGLRGYVIDGVYFTIGGSGAVELTNRSKTKKSYVFGPYLGIDYQPAMHVLITAQIMPYSQERTADGVRVQEIFQEGMLGISYLF